MSHTTNHLLSCCVKIALINHLGRLRDLCWEYRAISDTSDFTGKALWHNPDHPLLSWTLDQIDHSTKPIMEIVQNRSNIQLIWNCVITSLSAHVTLENLSILDLSLVGVGVCVHRSPCYLPPFDISSSIFKKLQACPPHTHTHTMIMYQNSRIDLHLNTVELKSSESQL